MEETGDRQLLNMFIRDAMKIPLMTREEENLEARRAVAGDIAARNRLVSANLRFVLAVVYRYRNLGIPLLDLLSAGCMGALIAASKYDPDVGVRFMTYAEYWIRQRMRRAIADEGRDPSTVSLDAPVPGDRERTLKDLLADDGRSFENALSGFDMERILEHSGVLTEGERRCLRLRYYRDLTQRQAAASLGVSRSWVAQIETKALHKLRRFLARSQRIGFSNIIEEQR